MDNIFDIYSAKVDNDKVTEWDSNLLFPRLICSHQSTRLQTMFVSWNLVIQDNHWLLLSERGIKNEKDTHKHFEICCASITLIYILILTVSCHRSFSLPKKCPNKIDNIFDKYSTKVDDDEVIEWDSNLLFPDWYAPTNPLDYRLCLSAEIWLLQKKCKKSL